MKMIAVVSLIFFTAQFSAATCRAAGFFKPINKAIKKATGVDVERPLDSPGVPKPAEDLLKKGGVTLPTPANPVVAPPQPPLHSLLERATKEVTSLADPLKPEQLKEAEAKLEKTKEQIKLVAKEAPAYVNLAIRALIWERKFPDPYGTIPANPLPNPSVELSVNQEMIDAMVKAWLGERIALDKGFVEITEAKVSLDSRNVIVVRIMQGRVNYTLGISHTPHIDDGTIELLPVIKKTTGPNGKQTIKLAFRGRCTALDIAKVGGELDRVLAHVITKHIDVDRGIGERNITEKITKPLDMGVVSKKQLVPFAEELRAFGTNGRLTVQAKLAFKVQAPTPKQAAKPAVTSKPAAAAPQRP